MVARKRFEPSSVGPKPTLIKTNVTFTYSSRAEPVRSFIEEAWRSSAPRLNVAPWKLDEPIWTIGSKLCSSRKCGKCPVEDL